jgi:N-acetylmuramoyl-L-alanine amidase
VVRHYDASRKICPRSMSENNWEKWWAFREKLSEKINDKLNDALEVLTKIGLINSPEYWLENAIEGKTVKGEYAEILIKRVVEYLNTNQKV